MNEPKIHKSVMVEMVVKALHIKNQALYIDGTLGTGGHTLSILENGGRVLGIDMDPGMIEIARERISKEFNHKNYKLVNGNFTDIDRIAKTNNWLPVNGILLDLGVSNLHLKDLERGFSFESSDAILDMRLNSESQGVRACDLLNVLRSDQLEKMFSVVLEGGPSRWLSARVIESRNKKPIETTGDFLEICEGIKTGKTGISAATLPFLALRIAVNSELDNLESVLPMAFELLENGGRLVVITFHSGEDKIVKDFIKSLKDLKNSETFIPSNEEIYENPRARSAKIRVMQKI